MFKPKNAKPLWRMVYEMVETLGVGDLVTYEDLDKILGEDSRQCRGAIYRASKELMKKHKKELVAERGEGYQIIEGMDMLSNAGEKHGRVGRLIKRADFEASSIDVVKLTPDQRNDLNNFLVGNREIAIALASNVKAIETGVIATRTQLTGAGAQLAGAQVTQLFTEEQVRKLKDLLGDK